MGVSWRGLTRRAAGAARGGGQLRDAAVAHAAGAGRRGRAEHGGHELRHQRLCAAERTPAAGADATGQGQRRWARGAGVSGRDRAAAGGAGARDAAGAAHGERRRDAAEEAAAGGVRGRRDLHGDRRRAAAEAAGGRVAAR